MLYRYIGFVVATSIGWGCNYGCEVDYIFGIGASQSPLDNYRGVLRSYDFEMGPGMGASYNFYMGTYPY